MISKANVLYEQIDSNLIAILYIAVLSLFRKIDRQKNSNILQNRNKKSYHSKYMNFRQTLV